MSEKIFDDLIKRASMPLKARGKTRGVKHSALNSGKQIHSHSSEDISGKQHDKSHE